MWFPLILAGLATAGCASAKSETDHRIGLLKVWFTNAQTVSFQTYDVDTRPQNVWPEVTVFDRARDPRVILMIAFSTGDAHSLRAVLKGRSDEQRPIQWSIRQISRATGGWRAARAWWSTDRLAKGSYRVELTIDSVQVGTYAFELE